MKNIPWVLITAVVGALIIGGLVSLIYSVNVTLTAQYDQMIIELCAANDALDNEVNVLAPFPELPAMGGEIAQIHRLDARRQDFFGNHAEGEAKIITAYQEKVKALRTKIARMIKNFDIQKYLDDANQSHETGNSLTKSAGTE